MFPTTPDLIANLYAELAKKTKPLPITLGSHNDIVGHGCGFNATLEYSCVFVHPEGNIEIGYDCPARRTVLCKDLSALSALPYEAQVRAIVEEAEAIGIRFDEHEPPWLWGKARMTREDALKQWLDNKFGDDPDFPDEQEFLWSLTGVGEHLPGFAIVERLPEQVAQQLKMRVVDIGGPASSVEAVVVNCARGQLADALRRNSLPFVLQDEG
jgi:hypothetical protein